MANVLFITSPYAGHIRPAVAIADELKRLNHTAQWVVHSHMSSHIPAEYHIHRLNIEQTEIDAATKELNQTKSIDEFQILFERFILPLAIHDWAQINKIIKQFKPDIVIVDQQNIGGAVACQYNSFKWLTLATTCVSLGINIPAIESWMIEQYEQVQVKLVGNRLLLRPDISPHGVIVTSIRELLTKNSQLHAGDYCFVGCCFQNRVSKDIKIWRDFCSKNKPVIYVSIGSVLDQHSQIFYETILEVLEEEGLSCIFARYKPSDASKYPNMIFGSFIPQTEILPYVDIVITHSGHNTVCESLSFGKPIISVPIAHDQFRISMRLKELGVAEVVKFKKMSKTSLQNKLKKVLYSDDYRQCAVKLQKQFQSKHGAEQAALFIESKL